MKKSAKKSVARSSGSNHEYVKLERFSYEFYLSLILIITLATLLIDVILLVRLNG